MTAGNGVAHAEETPHSYRGSLHAVQLWVAQPEATRRGPPGVRAPHRAAPGRARDGHGNGDQRRRRRRPVTGRRADSELVGVDLELRPGRIVVPLRDDFAGAVSTALLALTAC